MLFLEAQVGGRRNEYAYKLERFLYAVCSGSVGHLAQHCVYDAGLKQVAQFLSSSNLLQVSHYDHLAELLILRDLLKAADAVLRRAEVVSVFRGECEPGFVVLA